jgi:CHAD domain-containing protein
MAFCFKRKEPISKAICRLGRERVADALNCLKNCNHREAIHCARKDIKKARALLQLVRAKIEEKTLRRLRKRLGRAAKSLAEPRDAYVQVATLVKLMRQFKGRLAPGALRFIHAELRNDSRETMRRFARKKTAKVAKHELRCFKKELARLKFHGHGWMALSRGVKKTYAAGRCTYQALLDQPTAEGFHEWRKRAKDLQYHAVLLRPVCRRQMDVIIERLKDLGEHLGDAHDLVRLREVARKVCADDRHPREIETLNGLIDHRERDLRASALELGARLYAEKPSIFCSRLGACWATWCGEKSVG